MKAIPRIISIDRASKSWAVFDESFRILKDFVSYGSASNEEKALAEAKAWVAERTSLEPVVKYPRISSMRTSTRSR